LHRPEKPEYPSGIPFFPISFFFFPTDDLKGFKCFVAGGLTLCCKNIRKETNHEKWNQNNNDAIYTGN
jgi:hypothetical protein